MTKSITSVSLKMPVEMKKLMENVSFALGITQSELMRTATSEFLSRHDNEMRDRFKSILANHQGSETSLTPGVPDLTT